MSTSIVACSNMTLVIKRLTDYTVRHLSGLSNIPHLCVKVRHPNGFAWFGVNVIGITDTKPWTRVVEEEILKKFIDSLQNIIDMESLETDVQLLMRSLQDITTGRKRPLMFGGTGNEFVQISSENNIQIEVYRDEVKHEATTYGGFFATVRVRDRTYPVMAYHRGIILYNYLTKEAVCELIRKELPAQFPEVFPCDEITVRFSDIEVIPRNRNKKVI